VVAAVRRALGAQLVDPAREVASTLAPALVELLHGLFELALAQDGVELHRRQVLQLLQPLQRPHDPRREEVHEGLLALRAVAAARHGLYHHLRVLTEPPGVGVHARDKAADEVVAGRGGYRMSLKLIVLLARATLERGYKKLRELCFNWSGHDYQCLLLRLISWAM